ncbi:unnamed protein product [Rotaria sp. Silwood1]|nr:unnamed protein product [Rotaria sp. Silwood1]
MFDENVRNFRIIWLDKTFCYTDTSQRARASLYQLNSLLRTFSDVEKCFDYIRYIVDDTQYILFILSIDSFEENVDDIIQEVTGLIQVTFLYVLTTSNNREKLSEKDIRAIFTDEDQIQIKLVEDIKLCNEKGLKFNILTLGRSTKDLSRQSSKFMWYQYLMDILLAVPDADAAKTELIEFCCSNYAENPIELNKIREFEETYCSEQAIKWYTRDTFLFRLVNKVLRQENIDDMYKIRFILSDIHTQLMELHGDYLDLLLEKNLYPYCLTVYRGQLMSAYEFDQLKQNIGCFISMNSFLSTTTARDLSLIFSGQGQQRPQLESILFEITIETSTCETAFADIQHVSWMSSEEEILITIGAIFHIDLVYQIDNVWIVKLTLCNQKSEGIEKLADYFPEIKDNKHDLFTFADCLYSMGDYDRAATVFRRLLSSNSITNELMPIIWGKLAMCLSRQCHQNFGEIMNYFNISLDHITTESSSYSIRIDILIEIANCLLIREKYNETAEVLNQVRILIDQDIQQYGQQEKHTIQIVRYTMMKGIACSKMGEHRHALEHFHFARKIYYDNLPDGHERMGETHLYRSIAQSASKQETIESFQSMQRALELHLATLPPDHPSIADMYDIVAWIYLRHYDIMNAQKAFERSIEFRLKSKWFDPTHLAVTYIGLGNILGGDEGMSYLDKADNLYKEHLLPNSSKFIQLYISKAEIHLDKNEIEQARYYLTNVLKIELELKRSKPGNSLAVIYTLFGILHQKEAKYDISINYFEKSINIIKEFQSHAKLELAYNFLNLGRIYHEQNNLEFALSYYHQSLNVYLQLPLINKSRLATVHYNIAMILLLQDSYEKAFEHFQKTVEYQLHYLSSQSNQLFACYKNLMVVSKHLQDDIHFLEYSQKALDMIYRINPDELLEAVDIHIEIAQYWEEKNEYMRALQSYERVLQVNRQLLDEHHPLFITNYTTLAHMYSEIYEHQTAINYFHKALILNEHQGCKIVLLINIGMEYLNLEYLEKAQIYLEEALSLMDHSTDIKQEDMPSKLFYATALDSLARVKAQQGQYQEAKKLCQMGFDLRFGDLLATTVSFVTMGRIHNDQGDFDSAIICFHKAEMALKTLDIYHPSLVQIYAFRTGSAYYNHKQFDKALAYYEMALELAMQVARGNLKQIQRIRYGLDRIMNQILDSNQLDKYNSKPRKHCIIF